MAAWRMCQLLMRVAPRAAVPRTVCLSRSMSFLGEMSSEEEQATGLEKKVIQALKKGEDPYTMLPKKAKKGTKEHPHIVPSVNKYRIVGCVCEEDNTAVIWFWIHEGQTNRCPECGACYKLVHVEPPH
ncbi:cytochrome c oxidase subunit 5B, mitochondrial [Hyperolius riggenbachi]|uniref:cytochrome c oxidase subunit 5B, mitochondrial n=1 Tax=Hyperolius riggenbachi TaxID=752182 RepID=UPI0035A3462E